MPEAALSWGQVAFYVIAYAVGLSVLCVALLAYAYLASAWFTAEALRPTFDERGTRRD